MFLFAALSLAKTPMVGSKRFMSRIEQSPYSLVLFTTRGCGDCDKILGAMDGIYDKFTGRVSMLSVDVDASPDLKENYAVSHIPSVGIFAKNRFLQFYRGEWNREALINFCEGLFTGKIDVLETVFDVFEYQNTQYPANLIVANQSLFEHAKSILPFFPGTLKIAIIENQTVARQTGIEGAQIRRPLDSFIKNIAVLNETELQILAKPMIEMISNQEQLGSTETKHTLIALLDEFDQMQKHDIAKLWGNVSHLYKGSLSYQFCDFYKCNSVTSALGIMNFGNPLFVLSSKIGIRPKVQLFANPEPSQKDLEIWLNKQVLGIEEPDYRDNDGLPKLRAHEFMRVALDSKRDIVLFMASPGMPKYAEARENAKMLVELFQNIKGIEVYEFNPKTELVPGLQMPRTEKPMFSVWPATQSSQGQNFYAAQPLPAVVDEVFRIAKTKIDPTYYKQIGEMINEFMQRKK